MTFTHENLSAVESHLATTQWLSGKELPGSEDLTVLSGLNKDGVVPDFELYPNVFGWFWTLNPMSPPARALWGTAQVVASKPAAKKEEKKAAPTPAPTPAPKADDDDFDLFGDETEEDKKAAEELKTKVEAPKKVKVAPIAKSLVCFDVKGYEVGQDFEAMATKIRAEVNADGLIWMDTHEVKPLAFGMMFLRMTMLIVDDKIQTEDIFEQITAWEDDVQSTDIFTFGKA
jgi:translation elongation factor EF-1beta